MKRIQNELIMNTYISQYGLDNILCKELIQNIELFHCEKGESVCEVGEYMTYMFFLVRGKLKVYSTMDTGKAILLRFSTPLSVIGEVEWINKYEVKNTIESVYDSVLLGIRHEMLDVYGLNNPIFLNFVLKNVTQKLYTLSNVSSLNLLHPLENRLASYLLSTRIEEFQSDTIEEFQSTKLTEIADFLGTSYRHLNRVITKFVEEGIVERKKTGIYITNVEKLKELASGSLYE